MKSDDIYRIILTRMWGDEKFNRLSSPPPNGKYLWIFLCTGPFSNRLGLFKAGEMTLAEELGWELKGFREAFQEALVEGLLKVSDEYSKDRLIFIPNFLKINFPANPNVIKSWEREWNILPECGLKLEAWHHIKNLMESKDKETKAWSHAFTETCRKPFIKPSPKPLPKTSTLPLAKQEQEQEQEQEWGREQEQEREPKWGQERRRPQQQQGRPSPRRGRGSSVVVLGEVDEDGSGAGGSRRARRRRPAPGGGGLGGRGRGRRAPHRGGG